MFPVTGLARLAGRILSSVHMENFSPVTGLNSVRVLEHKNITHDFPRRISENYAIFIHTTTRNLSCNKRF